MSVRRRGWRAYSVESARRTSFLMSVRECEAGSVVEWSGSGSEREGLGLEVGLRGVLGRWGRRCVDVAVDVDCCCVDRGREGGSASASASGEEEDASSREMASARRLRVRGMAVGRWKAEGRRPRFRLFGTSIP